MKIFEIKPIIFKMQNLFFAEHSLLFRMSLYIFIYYIHHLSCLCNNFYDLSALVSCWSWAVVRRIIFKFSNVCRFVYTALRLVGRLGSR